MRLQFCTSLWYFFPFCIHSTSAISPPGSKTAASEPALCARTSRRPRQRSKPARQCERDRLSKVHSPRRPTRAVRLIQFHTTSRKGTPYPAPGTPQARYHSSDVRECLRLQQTTWAAGSMVPSLREAPKTLISVHKHQKPQQRRKSPAVTSLLILCNSFTSCALGLAGKEQSARVLSHSYIGKQVATSQTPKGALAKAHTLRRGATLSF